MAKVKVVITHDTETAMTSLQQLFAHEDWITLWSHFAANA